MSEYPKGQQPPQYQQSYAQPAYAQQQNYVHPAYAQPAYPPAGFGQPQTVYTPPPTQVVVIQDACVDGGHHVIEKSFDCCGILLAILFFPIGLICCFVMASNKCVKCGKHFG